MCEIKGRRNSKASVLIDGKVFEFEGNYLYSV